MPDGLIVDGRLGVWLWSDNVTVVAISRRSSKGSSHRHRCLRTLPRPRGWPRARTEQSISSGRSQSCAEGSEPLAGRECSRWVRAPRPQSAARRDGRLEGISRVVRAIVSDLSRLMARSLKAANTKASALARATRFVPHGRLSVMGNGSGSDG